MPNDPNQITQWLNDAAPLVVGAFAAFLGIILLISLLDGARSPGTPLENRRVRRTRRQRRRARHPGGSS